MTHILCEPFQLEKTHYCDDDRLAVHKCTHLDRTCIVVRPHENRDGLAATWNGDGIKAFCAHHTALFAERRAAGGSRGCVMVVYDLRRCTVPVPRILEVFAPIVKMCQAHAQDYQDFLAQTIIMIQNEAQREFLNYLLTQLYRPVRPVKVINRSHELRSIASTWLLQAPG